MVEAYGGYVTSSGGASHRLWLKLTRSGNTISYDFRLSVHGAIGATQAWSLSGADKSGNKAINQSSGWVHIATGSFTNAAKTTVTGKMTMWWGAVATVSVTIGAAGSPPAVPSGFSWTRSTTSQNAVTLKWTKGARATSTVVVMSKNGAAQTNLSSPTDTTLVIGMAADSVYEFWAYSKNSYGTSNQVSIGKIYTQPPAPKKPTLSQSGSRVVVSVTKNALHAYGLEVAQENGTRIGSLAGTGTSGTNLSVTDTSIVDARRYKARWFMGPAGTDTRVFSDWSPLSESVANTLYFPPELSGISAVRYNNGTGQPSPNGTAILVTATAECFGLAGITNTMTMKAEAKLSTSSNWAYPTSAWSGAAKSVGKQTTSWVISGLTAAIASVYDVRVTLTDKKGSESKSISVGVGSVPLSLSKTGAGIGGVWSSTVNDASLQVMGGGYLDYRQFNAHANGGRDIAVYYAEAMNSGKQIETIERATEAGLAVPKALSSHYGILYTTSPMVQSSAYFGLTQRFICGRCTNAWTRVSDGQTGWGPWTPISLDDPNIIVINGVAYARSGVANIPSGSFTATGDLYYRGIATYFTNLPAVPAPWGFEFDLIENSGAGGWIGISSTGVNWYVNASAARSGKVRWSVVKYGWRP